MQTDRATNAHHAVNAFVQLVDDVLPAADDEALTNLLDIAEELMSKHFSTLASPVSRHTGKAAKR